MQLKHFLIGGVVASTILPAQAVMLDRTFNNGGTTVMVSGAVSPTYTKTVRRFSYLHNNLRAFDYVVYSQDPYTPPEFNPGDIEDLLEYNSYSGTDERLRGGVNMGNIGINVQQLLNNKTALFSGLTLSYTPSGGGLYTSYLGVTNTRTRDMAMIGLGFLPTDSVPTTRNYNLLDIQAGGMVSGTLSRIPNVTLGAYYAFSDAPDGNPLDAGLRKGYGATASYVHSFGIRNTLTGNLGVSKSERRDDLEHNYVARDKTGIMAGLRYNYYDWTVAVDGGVSKSDFYGNIIHDAKTTAIGTRIGYDFTSRLNAYGYYGEQTTKSNEADGIDLNFNNLHRINWNAYGGTRPMIAEEQLFKTIKRDRYGIGASYAYHKNLSFNARAGFENTTYSLSDGDFAKRKNQDYSLGMSLSF